MKLLRDLRRTRQSESAELNLAETRALLAASFDRVIVFDADGRYLKVPKARHRLYRPYAETIGKLVTEVLPEPEASRFLEIIRRAIRTGETQRMKYQLDIFGERMMFDGIVAPTADNTAVWVARDISEQHRAEVALRESEAAHRDLLAALPVIVYRVSPDPPFAPMYVSPGVEVLGYTVEEWLSQPDTWLQIIHPDDHDRVIGETEAALASSNVLEYEYRVIAKDESIHWMHDRGEIVRDADGRAVVWRGMMTDVTERRALQDRLEMLLEQDELTGLYNRRGFRRMVEHELKTSRRLNRSAALLYIDLDAFKPINDTYGHAAGDEALRTAAKLLNRSVREVDLVGRIGGDEFAVFATGISTLAETDRLLARLYRNLANDNIECAERGRPFPIGFSVGVALVEPDDDLDKALARADAALYTQKSARKPTRG
jgi:diguanylate cyclase (GGDEF)-like protein